MLTTEQIFQAKDSKLAKVFVPEWKPEGMPDDEAFIFVRTMSGVDRDRFQAGLMIPGGTRARLNLANATAKLVSMAACDENGKRIFNDAQAAQLGQKSCLALDRVADAARHLNGLDAEDIRELRENFSEAQSDDSGSS